MMDEEEYKEFVAHMAGDARRILNDPFLKQWIDHRREKVYAAVRTVSLKDRDAVVAAVANLHAFERFVLDMMRPINQEKELRLEEEHAEKLSDLIY